MATTWKKVPLSGAIVNADIGSGAAIAYSKLNLDNSIASGDYVDASIENAHIADNAVGLDEMAGLDRGHIIYGDSSGNPASLANSTTDGHVLTVQNSSGDIGWEAAAAGDMSDLSDDTSPTLGGDLDTASSNILIDDAHGIMDEAGNEQLIFQETGSAVNYCEIQNSATGNSVHFSSQGSDSNVDLTLTAKGTGKVNIKTSILTVGHGTSSKAGQIDLYEASANGTNYGSIKAPLDASDANWVYTLPAASGTIAMTNSSMTGATSGNAATATLAAAATTVTLTDEGSDTTCFPVFAQSATGNVAMETDASALTYDASDGTLGATTFVGALTGLASTATTAAACSGDTAGSAATVTGAAQTAITSVGTLTALTVDNLGVNGNTITANSGALNLTPAAGSAIVLDGTINVDAGVVTGATSITSTAFVGAIAGTHTGGVKTTSIGFTDGDSAITIADTGLCTFPQIATFSSDVVIAGNLELTGTSTITNTDTEQIHLEDNSILMNSGNSGVAVDAGFLVEMGSTSATNQGMFYDVAHALASDGATGRWCVGSGATIAATSLTYGADLMQIRIDGAVPGSGDEVPIGHMQYHAGELYIRVEDS